MVKTGDFFANLQAGAVGRCSDGDQQAQRGLDREGGRRLVHIEPAHHRLHAVGEKEVVLGRAVEKLPWQSRQIGRIGGVDDEAQAFAALRVDGAQALFKTGAQW